MSESEPPAIRRAVTEDNPGLVALAEAVWPEAYSFADPMLARHTIDTWWSPEANARSLADTIVLVAESGEGLVGMGNIDLRPEVPVIWKLAVHPRVRGERIGLRLMRRLVELAGEAPVRLSYVEGNERAARFYTSFGFEAVGRNEPERPEWPGEIVVELRPRGSTGQSPQGHV